MEINYVAAVVAALSSLILGGIGYSPALFQKPWNKAMGRYDNCSQGHPARVLGFSFLFALLAAPAFAHLLGPAPNLAIAMQSGLFLGLWH